MDNSIQATHVNKLGALVLDFEGGEVWVIGSKGIKSSVDELCQRVIQIENITNIHVGVVFAQNEHDQQDFLDNGFTSALY